MVLRPHVASGGCGHAADLFRVPHGVHDQPVLSRLDGDEILAPVERQLADRLILAEFNDTFNRPILTYDVFYGIIHMSK